MRYIEPQQLIVNHSSIVFEENVRIALVADFHLGIYKNNSLLKKTVAEINKHDIDMVLIAGDFTLDASPESLKDMFEPLARLNAPVFSVLGNHDVERPGPAIRSILVPVLEEHGVHVLNNEAVVFSGFTLIGLGAHSNQEDDIMMLQGLDASKTIVLTHNPDTTLSYSDGQSADVTLAGHTHCGQLRIPYFYKRFIPTVGDFDGGLTTEPHTQLYITCGLGETALPIRFLNPPAIDIINLGPDD